MSGKQPRRQKCQPKVYTESDFRKALREALMNMEKHNLKLAIGAFALALHRKLNMPGEEIQEMLNLVQELSYEALCYQDVKKELKEAIGFDLDVCIDMV